MDPEPLSNRRNREQAGVRDTSLLDTPKRVERKARIVRDLFGRDIQLVAPSTKRRSLEQEFDKKLRRLQEKRPSSNRCSQ